MTWALQRKNGGIKEENMNVVETILVLVKRVYKLLVSSGNIFQILLLLFVRLNWGWQFYTTGLGKLTGHANVVEFFTSLNLPYPDITAWFVGGVECGGGILLIIGLASRPVGLILAVNMIVAYLSVDDDRQTLFNFFKEQDPFLKADPFFFMLTGMLAFAFGAGPLSIDALIKRLLKNNSGHKNFSSTAQNEEIDSSKVGSKH
jgi:putative oxidoreductase